MKSITLIFVGTYMYRLSEEDEVMLIEKLTNEFDADPENIQGLVNFARGVSAEVLSAPNHDAYAALADRAKEDQSAARPKIKICSSRTTFWIPKKQVLRHV